MKSWYPCLLNAKTSFCILSVCLSSDTQQSKACVSCISCCAFQGSAIPTFLQLSLWFIGGNILRLKLLYYKSQFLSKCKRQIVERRGSNWKTQQAIRSGLLIVWNMLYGNRAMKKLTVSQTATPLQVLCSFAEMGLALGNMSISWFPPYKPLFCTSTSVLAQCALLSFVKTFKHQRGSFQKQRCLPLVLDFK